MGLLRIDAEKLLSNKHYKPLDVEGLRAIKLRSGMTLRFDPKTDTHIIRLHTTDIIYLLPTKEGETQRYRIFAGDWRTSTTCARINEYTGSRISSEMGYWFIDGSLFTEGMVLDGFGEPEAAYRTPPEEVLAFRTNAKALDRAIAAYCKGFVKKSIENRSLDFPDIGDCWFCATRPVGKIVARGAEPMGSDHLINHFIEKYYVPSLLRNALYERFNWDSWQTGAQRDTPEEKLAKQENSMRSDYGSIIRDTMSGREHFLFYKVLRKYFHNRKHKLIVGFDAVDFKKQMKEADKERAEEAKEESE
jgi:hypothetical protein